MRITASCWDIRCNINGPGELDSSINGVEAVVILETEEEGVFKGLALVIVFCGGSGLKERSSLACAQRTTLPLFFSMLLFLPLEGILIGKREVTAIVEIAKRILNR